MTSWREQAAPIIARVIAETGRDDLPATVRKVQP